MRVRISGKTRKILRLTMGSPVFQKYPENGEPCFARIHSTSLTLLVKEIATVKQNKRDPYL